MSDKPIDVEAKAEEQTALTLRPESPGLPAKAPPERAITPAQAKVDAIASLTMQAYARASDLKLTPEEIAKLQAEFPDEAFKPGAAGKEHLIYIEHAFLRDRLNQVFGPGQWAIVPRNRWSQEFILPARERKPEVRGETVYVEAMLMVRGCFVGEAIGDMDYYPTNHSQNFGDAVEGAKTAALRRCCKELGIGLQAWKKDWCDSWWARKRASGARGGYQHTGQGSPRAGSAAGERPGVSEEGGFESAKPASAPKQDTEKPAPGRRTATKATLDWMIEHLKAREGEGGRDAVTEFFQKVAGLLPNEKLEDLPLRFVPVTTPHLNALTRAIGAFMNGEPAKLPYEIADLHMPTENGTKEGKSATKGGESATKPTKTATTKPLAEDGVEWFWDVVVPIPHKGQTRAEYMANPETIGSLFELRHGDDDEAAEARRRLWGFVTNYEAKGWTKRSGEQMPPSQGDIKFREALDAFADWFEKNHPGEKL